MIADSILQLADGWSPVVVLAALLIVTMTLSDVMNNTAKLSSWHLAAMLLVTIGAWAYHLK